MLRMTGSRAALLALALWAAPGIAQDAQSAAAPGRVQVLHNAAGLAAERLDIYVNGLLLPGADGLAFRTGTLFAPVVAGTLVTVVVTVDTSPTDTLAVATYVAESGLDHRVVVEGGRQSLTAQAFPGGAAFGPGENRVSLSLYNGSADDSILGYDLYRSSGSGVFNDSVSPSDRPKRFVVPVDDYNIRARLSGFPERLYTPADFHVPVRQTALFFASGSRTSGTAPLGLFVLFDDGSVVPLPLDAAVAAAAPPPAIAFRAWPNPARSRLWLAVGTLTEAQVDVLDLQGRRVWSSPSAPSRGGQLSVDVSTWPAGRYVARVRSPLGVSGQASVTVVH